MKKIYIIMLLLVLVITLTACVEENKIKCASLNGSCDFYSCIADLSPDLRTAQLYELKKQNCLIEENPKYELIETEYNSTRCNTTECIVKIYRVR